MESEKSSRQNRVREALGRIYDQHPPHFREYLRRYKEDPTSRVFAPLAEAYRRMGRVDEAIEVCREGLEHHPDFHGGRVALAKCYLDKKRNDEARAELERVTQFAPENLMAQRLLADVYLLLGDRVASLHACKMALMLSPNDVSLAEKIHLLEREIEEFGRMGNLEKPPAPVAPLAPVVDGETVTSSIRLATEEVAEILPSPDLEERTEPNTAVTQSAAAQEREPTPAPTAVLSESEEVASILREEGDSDEAFSIEHVSSIFGGAKSQSQQAITTGTLGDLYFSQGQFDRALRIFEKLAERHPNAELTRKIQMARSKLGVDRESLLRNRRIDVLRSILKSLQNQKPGL